MFVPHQSRLIDLASPTLSCLRSKYCHDGRDWSPQVPNSAFPPNRVTAWTEFGNTVPTATLQKVLQRGSRTTPFCPHHTWLANFQPSFRGRASSNFCRFVRYRPFHRLDPFGRWSVVVGSVGRCVFQRLPPTWFHLICHDYPLDRPRRRKALDLSWQACVWQTVSSCNFGLSSTILNRRTVLLATWPLAWLSILPAGLLLRKMCWRMRQTVQKMCEQCCIFFNSAAAQL